MEFGNQFDGIVIYFAEEPRARLKEDLNKLKALAPEENRHFYDVMIRIADAVIQSTRDFNVKKLIEELEEQVKTQEALISKLKPTDAHRQHQEIIKNSVENVVK